MLFGDSLVGAENNHKVSIKFITKLLLHVIIVKPTDFQGKNPGNEVGPKPLNIIKVHSPLKKREEIWSEFDLAVACGTIAGLETILLFII